MGLVAAAASRCPASVDLEVQASRNPSRRDPAGAVRVVSDEDQSHRRGATRKLDVGLPGEEPAAGSSQSETVNIWRT